MNLKCLILFFAFSIFVPCILMGQENIADHKINIEIPEVALLGLISDGSADINFIATTPEEAGNSVSFDNVAQTKSIWINYSSIVSNDVPDRKIIATVQGEIPDGVQLLVKASEATGIGGGKLGHSVGTVKLSNEPTDVIVDIGSCYTGKGANNGHYLTYQLNFDPTSDKYSQLIQKLVSFNVVYTLTDRN